MKQSTLQLLVAGAVALFILFFAFKVLADDPSHYSDPLGPTNVAYSTNYVLPPEVSVRTNPAGNGTQLHQIRASHAISEEAVRQYLEAEESPLYAWTDQLLQSPYWSTIIAICTIEQYSCSKAPTSSPGNFWGLMYDGHLKYYPTIGEGLAAIEAFLGQAEDHGRTTVESFRGWYCYEAAAADHICWNWETVVLRTKAQLEAL